MNFTNQPERRKNLRFRHRNHELARILRNFNRVFQYNGDLHLGLSGICNARTTGRMPFSIQAVVQRILDSAA